MKLTLSISNSFTYIYTNYYEIINKLTDGNIPEDIDKLELISELLQDKIPFKFKVYYTPSTNEVSILIHYQYMEPAIVENPEDMKELYSNFRDFVALQVETIEEYFTVYHYKIYNIILHGEFMKKGDLNLIKVQKYIYENYKDLLYYLGKPLGGGLEFAGLVANLRNPLTNNKVSMSFYTSKKFTSTHIMEDDIPFWWEILESINDNIIGDKKPIFSKDIKLFKHI